MYRGTVAQVPVQAAGSIPGGHSKVSARRLLLGLVCTNTNPVAYPASTTRSERHLLARLRKTRCGGMLPSRDLANPTKRPTVRSMRVQSEAVVSGPDVPAASEVTSFSQDGVNIVLLVSAAPPTPAEQQLRLYQAPGSGWSLAARGQGCVMCCVW